MYRLATIRKQQQPVFQFVARIPELNHYLLRHEEGLEIWRPAIGAPLGSIVLRELELEFVRYADKAYRIPDNPYNRSNCPDDIGRVYVDTKPGYAMALEI